MIVTPVKPIRHVCYGLHQRKAVLYVDDKRCEYPEGDEGIKQAWIDYSALKKGIIV